MTVYLQLDEAGGFGMEQRLVYQYCTMERLRARTFEIDTLLQGALDLADCDLLVGSVQGVRAALTQLGVAVPEADYYPAVLQPFLQRDTWATTAGEVLSLLDGGEVVFAKSLAWKGITGQVFRDGDQALLHPYPHDTPMVAATPVQWLGEFRVYVQHHQVVACCQYEGADGIELDRRMIDLAVERLQATPGTPAAYAFDWGLLDTGATALVEMGDAWAIGAYPGISYRAYFALLQTRWNEMLAEPRTDPAGGEQPEKTGAPG